LPRPRKCRLVQQPPVAVFYKPQGVPMRALRGVVLPVEGLEALRLVDMEGMDQETAAGRMGVSRPTLSRVLAQARATVARALVNGWAIRIEGGDYELAAGPSGGRPGQAGPGPGRGRRGWRGGR